MSETTLRIFTEARLHDDETGGIRAIDATGGWSAWEPYHEGLGSVQVAARLGPPQPEAVVEVGPVSVRALPYYQGLFGLLRRGPQLVLALWRATGEDQPSLIRLPGAVGFGAGLIARLRRRPYAVEVLGDPETLLQAGVAGRLGVALAPASGRLMRWIVRGAAGGRYVTREALQRRYPLPPTAGGHSYSTVRLEPEDFAEAPRRVERPARRLVTVGAQDHLYKGHQDLIEAVALLRQAGNDYELTLVGGGRCQAQLKALAAERGVADLVAFTGRVHERAQLRKLLDRADLYVQPSRTEGLPRALIEAMARGLPAVGTDVGGIGELLPADLLVAAGQPQELAGLIARLAERLDRLGRASAEGLRVAQDYSAGEQATRVADWMRFLREWRGQPHDAGVRVAHVFGAMDRGGAELRTIELAARVPDVEHTYVTLTGRRGELADQIERTGGTVRPCRLSLAWPVAFPRLLRRDRIDVVVSNVATFSGLVLLLARCAGVRRRIAYLRSDGDQHGDNPRRRLQRRVMRGLLRISATEIVGNAPGALRFAYGPDRAADSRGRVIPDGVEPGPAPDRDGPPPSRLRIVHVARPLVTKRRDRAVELLAAVRGAGVPATLDLVGTVEPGERRELQALAAELGMASEVTFVGLRSDVPVLMRDADVLLVTSTREGLPGVVLEALAAGCPVVATDLPGTRFIAEQCVGLQVVEGDEDARWVDALRRIASADPPRTAIWRGFCGSDFAMASAVTEVSELWRAR